MVPWNIIIHLRAAAPRSISTLIGGKNGYNKDDELHVVTKFLSVATGRGAREGGRPGRHFSGAAFEGRKLEFWHLHCNV